jgi:hypothetical protein
MYLQKVISKRTKKKDLFCVGIVTATEEKSRIRKRTKMQRIHNTAPYPSRFSKVNGAILRMNQAGGVPYRYLTMFEIQL